MTTAVVVGATGLTGAALVRQLLEEPRFTAVTAFTRRTTGVTHPKLREEVVSFDRPEAWGEQVRGDAAFSCLGTTKGDAGSLSAQRKVDFDYQLAFAQAAAKNGVGSFVLVSAMGANATSSIAYSRMKGELDDAVSALPLPRVRILRPGLLDGSRERPRLGERMSLPVVRFLTSLGVARAYRPITGETVAKGMIAAVFDGSEARRIYTGAELFTLADTASKSA